MRALPRLLGNNLVTVSIVPLLTVGEEPVENQAADGEDEDQDGPQELVADGAARLEKFNCGELLAWQEQDTMNRLRNVLQTSLLRG